MASITEANLKISHDHRKKTARPVVTAKVAFTPVEVCQMKSCPEGRWWKLKCELWSDDDWPDADDRLYTYTDVYYFPDPSPTSTETRTFDVTVGEGLLDEDDWWLNRTDEIYGRLILTNLTNGVTTRRKTNQVEHRF